MIDQQTLEGQIEAMSDEAMTNLLVELGDSTYFPAIIRYTRQRSEQVVNGMWTIDPVKDATLLARYQGVKAGLDDIEGFVRTVDAQRKEREKEADEKK